MHIIIHGGEIWGGPGEHRFFRTEIWRGMCNHCSVEEAQVSPVCNALVCCTAHISGQRWNGRKNHGQSLQIQTACVSVLIHIHYVTMSWLIRWNCAECLYDSYFSTPIYHLSVQSFDANVHRRCSAHLQATSSKRSRPRDISSRQQRPSWQLSPTWTPRPNAWKQRQLQALQLPRQRQKCGWNDLRQERLQSKAQDLHPKRRAHWIQCYLAWGGLKGILTVFSVCFDFMCSPACDHVNRSKLFGWWFGTFLSFPYIGNNHPDWRTHIFSEG